jgi:hypothetical protein
MMATSVVNLLSASQADQSSELLSKLETLPSYSNRTVKSNELNAFDDDEEPESGLINFIRRNTQSEHEPISSSMANVDRHHRIKLRLYRYVPQLCLDRQ